MARARPSCRPATFVHCRNALQPTPTDHPGDAVRGCRVTRPSAARGHLAASVRVVRAVIRNPALRRIELAFLLFNAVEFGTWVAILLYAYDTSGPAAVGVIALAQLLPAGILAPFAASLADRYPRERVLLVGYLVQAFVFGAAGAGMLLGAPAIAVYIAGAAAAAALTVIRPTQGSLLPSLARTPEELTAANGLSGTVEGVAAERARNVPPLTVL